MTIVRKYESFPVTKKDVDALKEIIIFWIRDILREHIKQKGEFLEM